MAINNGSANEQNNKLFSDFEINDKLEADSDQYIPVKCNASLKALPPGTTYKSKLQRGWTDLMSTKYFNQMIPGYTLAFRGHDVTPGTKGNYFRSITGC